jgi:hypothetical protein
VSTMYEILRQRLVDIICNGRGADGALGADAQQKSIPLGTFRPAADRAPLTDPTYPASQFDSAFDVQWIAEDDDGATNNPLDSTQIVKATITIRNAVVYGTGVSGFVSPHGAEVRATVALQPQERALAMAARIRRAVENPDLLRGGTALDPTPLACVREGQTTLQDLGAGRLLAVTYYSYRFQFDNTASYAP